jgi:hypothetical protein
MQDGHSINKQTNSSCRQADQAGGGGGGGGGGGSKAAAVGRDREKGSNVEQQEATAAGQVVGTTFEKLFESAIGGKECCIIASQACLCNRFAPKAPGVVIPVGCPAAAAERKAGKKPESLMPATNLAKKLRMAQPASEKAHQLQHVKSMLAEGKYTPDEARAAFAQLQRVASDTGHEGSDELPRNFKMHDISTQQQVGPVVPALVRIDRTFIVGTEEIELEKKPQYKVDSFPAWSLKRCVLGEDPTSLVANKDGKLGRRFSLTGRLATLPEFHKALVLLQRGAKNTEYIMPSVERMLRAEPDAFGCIDISTNGDPIYEDKMYAFAGGFVVFVEWSVFQTKSHHDVKYLALTVCKRKSDKAREEEVFNKKKYFTLNISAKRIPHLILGLEYLMAVNNLRPLVDSSDVVMVEQARNKGQQQKQHQQQQQQQQQQEQTPPPPKGKVVRFEEGTDSESEYSCDESGFATMEEDSAEATDSEESSQELLPPSYLMGEEEGKGDDDDDDDDDDDVVPSDMEIVSAAEDDSEVDDDEVAVVRGDDVDDDDADTDVIESEEEEGMVIIRRPAKKAKRG